MDNQVLTHNIYFEHLTPNAITPSRATSESAGLDLHSPYAVIIPGGATCLIKLDFRIHLPPGTYGRICERSGLALHHSIIVKGGIIDRDYQGNVGVILFNHGMESFSVARGDRIAQLIVELHLWPTKIMEFPFKGGLPVMQTVPVPNPSFDERMGAGVTFDRRQPKNVKERGVKGFGSSGR